MAFDPDLAGTDPFQEFEENLNRLSEEIFSAWDDYIEWKAYREREKVLALG
jgi:hypothetical protein